MKKFAALATLGVILLAAAIFYFQPYLIVKKNADPWELIPATALIVYERDGCESCLSEVHQSPLWEIIDKASFFQKEIDSLKGAFEHVLASDPNMVISIHPTKKDDFDFVFYTSDPQKQLQNGQVFAKKNFRLTKREFNNVDIHEVAFAKHVFSWAVIGKMWVGSFTPFLIEDVVRTQMKDNSLKQAMASVKKLPQVSGDAGNLYLQLNNFADWLSLFYADAKALPAAFGQSTALDIKSSDGHIVLNGFSVDTSANKTFLLSIFRNQSPVSFTQKNYISTNTIALHSFGVSDGRAFHSDLEGFARQRAPQRRDSLKIIATRTAVDLNSLYDNIHDEVGLCFIESSKNRRFSRIMIIETKSATPWLLAFEKIQEKLSIDTIFYERYGEYEIREVPVFRFPEKMFWPLVEGFDQCYYTSVNDIIIIGENLQDLKRFLNDIDEDNTWGRSVSHNKFLETTLLESNFSLYINTPKVWNVLAARLQPRWGQFMRENQSLLRSVQLSAIQFSHLNNSYYTNVSINYKPSQSSSASSDRVAKYVTNFEHGIQGLYAVKSHVDRSDEMLVQDSVNDLSLISDKGEVLWKVPLGDPITSDVMQIDYFTNGKLQYFFTTRSGLHVIDRLGNYVTPFPALLSPIILRHAAVVDYDHSRKYRFLTADDRGRLWMYDKQVNNLEGWQPKEFGAELACTPRHHRIKGKDYIIAITKDGKAFVMNRRGETLKNFPLDLHARPAGDYFLEIGNNLSDTYFVVVSDDGFRIKFTLAGKIHSREPLIKTSVNSRYRLIADKRLSGYVIAHQDENHFYVQDETGKRLVSNDAIGKNKVIVNYHDFGGGRIFITVRDLTQDLTYIYDGSGSMVTSVPVESSMLEIRPKDADENTLFFVKGKKLNIQPIGR